MVSTNRYEGKDRRRERRRNHIAKDLKTDKYHQRIMPDRKRKQLNDNDEYFFEEVYLADADT